MDSGFTYSRVENGMGLSIYLPAASLQEMANWGHSLLGEA